VGVTVGLPRTPASAYHPTANYTVEHISSASAAALHCRRLIRAKPAITLNGLGTSAGVDGNGVGSPCCAGNYSLFFV